MPTVTALEQTLKQAVTAEVAADPGCLDRNLGRSNYALMDRACRRLRAVDPRWHLLGKTSDRDGARYQPADWRPLTVSYHGQPVALAGVSHDVLFWVGSVDDNPGAFPFGVQFDCLGSANYWDTPIADKAAITCHAIPTNNPDTGDLQYRSWNPPVEPGQWLTGVPQPNPTPQPQPPDSTPGGPLNFPPRDATGRFFERLNTYYREHGRSDRGGGLHVDNEGLFVWIGEWLRNYVTLQHEQRASDATIAQLDAEWPKG